MTLLMRTKLLMVPTAPPPVIAPPTLGPVVGKDTPRLWTPPLRELTPETSFGFELIEFAKEIGQPFDPWQEWLAIHIGELLPDGRPRFRFVLVLVARQNGKTVFSRVLTLFWMFRKHIPLILGTSTSRDEAKESWREVIDIARETPVLSQALPEKHLREAIGEEAFFTDKSKYRFAATNKRAGRGKTVHRAVLDELRQHQNKDCYNAVVYAMNAVFDGQIVAITNEGDESAVVLDELRDQAQEFIETGVGDERLGLFSWSSPPGCDPTDTDALAQANPSLGYRQHIDNIIGLAIRAKAAGGKSLADFRTEVLCQKVALLDPAIEPDAWIAAGTDQPIDLAKHRDKLALCLDVALDGSHATLMAAASVDGKTHVEVIKKWMGYGCTKAVRADLPDIVERIRPRVVGWFPGGPAAAIAPTLRSKKGNRQWYPAGVKVVELTAEQTPACMGLAEQVLSGDIQHPKDAMLNEHVKQTQKLRRQDTWVFTRRGDKPIDGSYAMAGAVHLARTLKPRVPLSVA